MTNEVAITQASNAGALEVRQQVNAIQHLMREVLQDGQHYGKVPGCGPKPTLLQPGAEKIAYMFHLVPTYDVARTDYDGGHREYEITCKLTSRDTGEVMGYGVGTCTTLESRYRYRKGREVENPADSYNTVMKMAKKRAFVDAVKSTTAASDIFTQDVEDMPAAAAQPVAVVVEAEPAAPAQNPDAAWLRAVVDQAAARGYDAGEVQEYLGGLLESGGRAAAAKAVEVMLSAGAAAIEGEPVEIEVEV